jgi:hypothetical protein
LNLLALKLLATNGRVELRLGQGWQLIRSAIDPHGGQFAGIHRCNPLPQKELQP